MNTKPTNWDLEVDFIAVGSGGGAITGALAAHDLGKKAVVLEKAPKLDGVTAYSGGEIFLANNHVMQRQDMPDSFEAGRGEYPWANRFLGDRNYPNPNMGKLEKPPFYGLKLSATNSGVNAAGLKINKNGQVMSVRGEPIKGLYAAGNSAAHIDTGTGYQSGIANLRGIAWGWISAHHALK